MTILFISTWKAYHTEIMGAQGLSGRVLESRPRGCGLEHHTARHINPCLVLIQPRKTRFDITENVLTRTQRINVIFISYLHPVHVFCVIMYEEMKKVNKHFYESLKYCKTCVKWPLTKRLNIGF